MTRLDEGDVTHVILHFTMTSLEESNTMTPETILDKVSEAVHHAKKLVPTKFTTWEITQEVTIILKILFNSLESFPSSKVLIFLLPLIQCVWNFYKFTKLGGQVEDIVKSRKGGKSEEEKPILKASAPPVFPGV